MESCEYNQYTTISLNKVITVNTAYLKWPLLSKIVKLNAGRLE